VELYIDKRHNMHQGGELRNSIKKKKPNSGEVAMPCALRLSEAARIDMHSSY
jgi:hypothetical protein